AAAAIAGVAGDRGGDGDALLRSLESVLQRDAEVITQVRATGIGAGPPAPRSTRATEEILEDIGEAAAKIEARRAGPRAAAHAAFEGAVAEAVVGRALLVILQHVIGFVHFLEFLFRIGIIGVAVGM